MDPGEYRPIAMNFGKEYEFLYIKADPMFDELVRATEIVRRFIIEKGLIVYGGTAIDMSLRLRGDKIYPDEMLAVPDLDFFSPESVTHSYELADRLYAAGFVNCRSINAIHFTARRVDIGDGHYVADIGYIAPEIFSRLPTLKFNGMRIIHPDFQRIDMHSALSFPYENAPMEVVLHRWRKDIKRFNQLALKYPIKSAQVPTYEAPLITVPILRGVLYTGWLAYAIIVAAHDKLLDRKYPRPKLVIGDSAILLESDHVEIVSHSPEKILSRSLNYESATEELSSGELSSGEKILGGVTSDIMDDHHDMRDPPEDLQELSDTSNGVTNGASYEEYERYHTLIPHHYKCKINEVDFVIYDLSHHLIAYDSVSLESHKIRITNIQWLMKTFLAKYWKTGEAINLIAYEALLSLIEKNPSGELLTPSVKTYGDSNVSTMREIVVNGIEHITKGVPLFNKPANYFPDRKKPWPKFDIAASEFFQESGRRIIRAATN